MNNNLTEIVAVLDRSASMQHLTNDTIRGFNDFLKEQREIPGEAVLTTVLFNDSCRVLHDRVNIKKIKPISGKEYFAQGNTALFDAMGKTIDDIGLKLYKTAENERPGKVIFFIITAGKENASHKYAKEKIKAMVELQKNTYSWEFIFMGANTDALSTASALGISGNRSFNYAADKEGVYSVQMAMSAAVSNLRKFKDVDAAQGINYREKIKRPKN